MTQNTAPIFPHIPDVQWNTVSSANTAKDGTGTVVTVFTADATDGSFVRFLRIRPLGTNVVTVLRVFLNNGSTNATAANNTLLDEVTLPATTLSEIGAIQGSDLDLNIALPPGYKINVTLGTAVAAGFAVTAVGGDY